MSSQNFIRYRYKCLSGHDEVYETLREDEPAPVNCRLNTTHEIDTNSMVIVEVISKNIVTIQEESIATGGSFGTASVTLTSSANSSSSMDWVCEIPINVLAIEFVTAEIHTNDEIDIVIGANIPVGMVRTSVAPLDGSCVFVGNRAYAKGSVVTFIHPNTIYGNRVYTCVKNTSPGVLPINQLGFTNKEYWIHGYPVYVDDAVLSRVQLGYEATLTDMSNGRTSVLEMITFIDKSQKIVFTKKSPDKILNYPFTVLKQTIHPVRRYLIGASGKYELGGHKIGASYLPEDVPVTVKYTNKSTSGAPKTLVGGIEFLY